MAREMRVLIISYMGPKAHSGVRVYWQLLQKRLPEMGVHVEVVTPWLCSLPIRYLNILVQNLLFRPGFVRGSYRILLGNILYWISVRSALKRIKVFPDVIHAMDPGSASAAVRLFKGKIPVLTTCHFNDDLTDEALLRYGLVGARASALRRWHAWTFKHTREWTADSRYSAEILRRLVPADAQIRIIPIGLDLDEPSQTIPDNNLGQEYPGKILVLNVGTLETRKNQLLILNLADQLRDTPAIFLLVGDGPDRLMIEEEIQHRRLAETVKLLGYRNDLYSVMRACDAYIHTALRDNFPLTLIQAVAAGLPVLASVSGGAPEILGWEEESCFSLELGNEVVTGRIRKLIADTSYRHDLASRQHDHVLRVCSLDTMIHSLIERYSEIARFR